MSEIQIPLKAVKAARLAYVSAVREELGSPIKIKTGDAMTEAIRAALEAWPGMRCTVENTKHYTVVILPLPQEPRDDNS